MPGGPFHPYLIATNHTDASDWGTLHSRTTRNPSGAVPGIRKQFANDYLFSDWLLARGYAYASTDKGNNGTNFYRDGLTPGDAIVEWNERVTELTLAAKSVVQQRYG